MRRRNAIQALKVAPVWKVLLMKTQTTQDFSPSRGSLVGEKKKKIPVQIPALYFQTTLTDAKQSDELELLRKLMHCAPPFIQPRSHPTRSAGFPTAHAHFQTHTQHCQNALSSVDCFPKHTPLPTSFQN